MRQVADSEVTANWEQLLREAEAGETIAITRRGKVVAQLSPAHGEDASAKDTSSHGGEGMSWQDWVRRVKKRRARLEGSTVSTDEILAWIREGRR